MDHVFIINPVAGRGKALKFVSEIRSYFKGENAKYTVKVTKYPRHATEIAREYARKGAKRIYSVGGDGTLNEVVNGLVGEKSSLGVLPGGSGNDFLRSVTNNFDNILDRTISGSEKNIDVGRVNDKYFINISSMGFDAQVAYTANRLKKSGPIKGGLAYSIAIFAAILKSESYKLDISIDNEEFSNDTLLTAVANGLYYGGGMKPAPSARIDDGLFDICLINRKSIFEILKFFPKLIKGVHGEIEGVSFYKCKRIEIESGKNIPLNIDGDVEIVNKALFEIAPEGISLIIPKTV